MAKTYAGLKDPEAMRRYARAVVSLLHDYQR